MSSFTENPRAEASRRNGAKSHGPVTDEGKASTSRNALKHGFRAETVILIEGEDEVEFQALDEALKNDLQPVGPLESLLASRLTIAAWRMARADRIESDIFSTRGARGQTSSLGTRLVRDRHGPQAIDSLIRYRGTTQAEFWRALAALRTLQAQRRDTRPTATAQNRALPPGAAGTRLIPADVLETGAAVTEVAVRPVRPVRPNEPEGR